MLRFNLVFVGVLIVFALLWQVRPVYEAVNAPWTQGTAFLSYRLMSLLDADVAAQGSIIYSTATQKAVEIKNGCNGLEGTMVVVAAVLAFPASFVAKAWGILLGTLAVQLVNLIRVISLYYLNIWSPALFEWTHLYLWQALIILDAFIFFLIWIKWISKTQPTA